MSVNVCGSLQHAFLTPEDLARDDQFCCMGAVMNGPNGCTCWDAAFDLVQSDPAVDIGATRRTRCHDCAFKRDSPERAEGRALETLLAFYCHQGMRRPVAYVHPDGRRREVVDSPDYQPPFVAGVPYRADGSPADLCAGWAQAQRLRLGSVAGVSLNTSVAPAITSPTHGTDAPTVGHASDTVKRAESVAEAYQ